MTKAKGTKQAVKCKVASLDEAGRLVGYVVKDAPEPGDVRVPFGCDLPADGTYHWDAERGQFVKAGHEAMPQRAPLSQSEMNYHLARSLPNPPDEVRQWIEWYERRTGRGTR